MSPPAPFCPDVVVLLTSLFGEAREAGGWPRIGTPEPCEKVMEDESGPTLDLRLPFWDSGRSDSLLIQESFDETESLLFSDTD